MTASTRSIGEAPHAYARLRQAMAPDPSRWRYTGKVNDTGEYGGSRCACGHEIRYEFIIACEDDARTLIIGSTCIETNVPSLMRDGAARLAGELEAANRKLKRDLASQRRDLQAEEALPALEADYRRLRNWCFARRNEWRDGGDRRQMPQVFFWIEKLPEEQETPSRWTAAIRRRYVSMWLKSAQALCDHPAQFSQADRLPLPAQPKLFARLTSAVQREAGKWGATNRKGAIMALERHRALQADVQPVEPAQGDEVA
jgi:hypothetical protein